MANEALAIEKKPEVKELSTAADKALEYAEKAVIKSDDDRDNVSKAVIALLDRKKKAVTMRKFFTDPLNAQVKNINGLFMPFVKTFESAERILRDKLGAYHEKQEAIAAAATKKVEEDLAKGKIKNVETAVRHLDKIVEPEKTQRGEDATISYTEKLVVTVYNDELVPREFCSPDPKIFEDVAKARFKGKLEMIPGIKVEVKKVPSFRAK